LATLMGVTEFGKKLTNKETKTEEEWYIKHNTSS
jgi:hypothetical protein